MSEEAMKVFSNHYDLVWLRFNYFTSAAIHCATFNNFIMLHDCFLGFLPLLMQHSDLSGQSIINPVNQYLAHHFTEELSESILRTSL